MTADLGLRLKDDVAVQTHVSLTTTSRVICAHGRDAWLVGGETWHPKKSQPKDSRCELLEPCTGRAK